MTDPIVRFFGWLFEAPYRAYEASCRWVLDFIDDPREKLPGPMSVIDFCIAVTGAAFGILFIVNPLYWLLGEPSDPVWDVVITLAVAVMSSKTADRWMTRYHDWYYLGGEPRRD